MTELPEAGYYNAREWAKSFEITEGQFKEWVKQYGIPHFKIGHSMVVRAQDFWPRVPFVAHDDDSTVDSGDRTDAGAKEREGGADGIRWLPPDGSGEFNVHAWAGFLGRSERAVRDYMAQVDVRVIGDQHFMSPEALREAFPLVKPHTGERTRARRSVKGGEA